MTEGTGEKEKEGAREKERPGGTKGSRKSGSWSGQGDVLCASYILHVRVHVYHCGVRNERRPHIFRAYSLADQNDADNRVTRA